MRLSSLAGIVIASALLSGCQKKGQPKHDAQTFRAPSAAELFDLETKCYAMGQTRLEGNLIGSALTQSQVSHYNPSDNRCYVMLDVSTADLRTPPAEFIDDSYLIDGQTGENLAVRYCKGRSCTAEVFDKSLKSIIKNPQQPSETDVRDLMDEFVHTERHLR